MGLIRVSKRELEIDQDCFLKNFQEWDEEVAMVIAREIEGIDEIRDEQWKLIRFTRHHYEEHGTPPNLRKLTNELDTSMTEIHELFPRGPNSVFRIAGVPKYNGCCL